MASAALHAATLSITARSCRAGSGGTGDADAPLVQLRLQPRLPREHAAETTPVRSC